MAPTTRYAWRIGEIVDFDRYPIDDLQSSAARRVVDRCRADLRETGSCQLEGFMRPAAVEDVLAEAAALDHLAFRTESPHNVYFEADDPELPLDDPRRSQVRSAKRAIGWNHIRPRCALRALYEWEGLTAFIGVALEAPALYRDSDPVGACSLMLYDEGDELGWHFDNSEFAVTLMLQSSNRGGAFEYVPRIRSAHEENYGAVRALLAGARDGVLPIDAQNGTLGLFQGRFSIHRVTPVEGAKPRINAVLAYAREPDHQLTEQTRDLFYGAAPSPSGG